MYISFHLQYHLEPPLNVRYPMQSVLLSEREHKQVLVYIISIANRPEKIESFLDSFDVFRPIHATMEANGTERMDWRC